MLDTLIHWDQEATLALNQLHTTAGDHFWLMMSDLWVWVPFYAFLIYMIIRRLGGNGASCSLPPSSSVLP